MTDARVPQPPAEAVPTAADEAPAETAPPGPDQTAPAVAPGETAEPGAPDETAPAGPALTGVLTTTLVHRRSPSPAPWWHSAVVTEVPGLADVPGLAALAADMTHLSRLGVDALQVWCPGLDPAAEPARAAVTELVRRAHQRGLRVIVALDAAPPEDLLGAAGAWLDHGVDGIDLRGADGLPIGALQALVAGRSEEGVLTGAASGRDREHLLARLREEWLHITRDDRLALAPWDAGALREAVTDAFTHRDAVGTTGGWQLHRLGPEAGPPAWAVPAETRERRAAAMTLLMLALPGAVYLRQGDGPGVDPGPGPVAAAVARVSAAAQEQRGVPGSRYEVVRRALGLRHELRLGTGPLAWVDDATGPDTLVLLSGDLIAVVNLTGARVSVATSRELIHASGPVPLADGDRVVVPAETTVWLAPR
ncbi:hypothetical protein MF406_11000 [Georgenia sp. TF02-10]|uniref:hypothetical protein n=1 Tax=Georgenia sp. TF02-10 TaxID=2917725 RepID=UPI001FA7B958|nr:hypothetical protein [Georgenia sp. TF02-10]UNX53521.1 hypothetical protein MF406_11000 [Georgenia sp. TF02-10]